MGKVERLMMLSLIRHIEAGGLMMTADELSDGARQAGVLKGAGLERGVERLSVRGLLIAQWRNGEVIGFRPSQKAYIELGLTPPAEEPSQFH